MTSVFLVVTVLSLLAFGWAFFIKWASYKCSKDTKEE